MNKLLLSGDWVRSKYSTSWILALLLVVNYTFTGLLVQPGSTTHGINSQLFDLVSASTVALTLLASNWLVAKTKLNRVAQVAIVWLVTAIVPELPVGLWVHLISDGAETATYFSQLPVHVLSVLASCYVFGLLTAALAEGLARSRQLRRTYAGLLQVRRQLAAELDDLALEYSKPIGERLRSFVQARSKRGIDTPTELAEAIFDFSGNDLRSNVRDISASAPGSTTPKTWFGSRIGLAASSAFTKVRFDQSLGVLGLTLVASAYFVTSFWLIVGVTAAIAVALSLLVAALFWMLVGRLLNQVSARWWVFTLVNGGIYFAAINLSGLFARMFGASVDSELVLATSGMSSLLAMVLSSLESLVVRRQQLQQALEQWNVSLSESSATLNERLNLVRTNVAKHLHNNVQSQLVALALKLKGLGDAWPAGDGGADLSRDAALKSLAEIAQTADKATIKQAGIREALVELEEFWQGALKVTFENDSNSSDVIDADVALRSKVLTVLRECLTNAAKHSVDGTVRVELSLVSGKVLLRSSNKVSSTASVSQPTGVGTRTMQESTSSWRASTSDGVYLFEASF